jgi:hypothetical protein
MKIRPQPSQLEVHLYVKIDDFQLWIPKPGCLGCSSNIFQININ